jgi:hypothetical protein
MLNIILLALICFLLAAVNVVSRINLVALGLFFWLLSVVVTSIR